MWAAWSRPALVAGQHLSWWLAIGLILLFIPYFPYTKHFHLIMSGANFLTKPQRTSLGALDPIDFEDESVEEFGVARIEELPWTHLVDAYACIMCNRCQDACPAYVTGKELSPGRAGSQQALLPQRPPGRAGRRRSSPSARSLDYAISESAVWACTACGACVDICPVGNEPMFDIIYMRRQQVLMEKRRSRISSSRPTAAWSATATRGTSAPADRHGLGRRLDVPTIEQNPDPDVLWWVGCAPAYDPRARETARAFASVLNAAGVNFAVLGDMETCTGDAARRSGNEYLFYELAQTNIETLNEVAPKRIVTTCPHCLHTLGKEYGQYGARYLDGCDVIHHSQLLAELEVGNRIPSAPETAADRIAAASRSMIRATWADRTASTEAPRQVLSRLTAALTEMPRHGAQSFCCGAGGAQMWKEEEPGDGSPSTPSATPKRRPPARIPSPPAARSA